MFCFLNLHSAWKIYQWHYNKLAVACGGVDCRYGFSSYNRRSVSVSHLANIVSLLAVIVVVTVRCHLSSFFLLHRRVSFVSFCDYHRVSLGSFCYIGGCQLSLSLSLSVISQGVTCLFLLHRTVSLVSFCYIVGCHLSLSVTSQGVTCLFLLHRRVSHVSFCYIAGCHMSLSVTS